jgi:hypothetical protein
MPAQKIYCLLTFMLLSFASQGQSTTLNSLDPGTKKVFYSPKHEKKVKTRKVNVKHTPRYEFYKRVEVAAKEKQKTLKKLSKAQYSDRRYFGHKHIPTRRPWYKIRYCKECGIRH